MVDVDHSNGRPVLYSFRRCPYAMRARLAIKAAGVAVLLREVVLRDKPQALMAASPKATVPVLVLADGRVLDESLDVMRWALALHDPQGWVRPAERAEVDGLIARNDGPFKQALDRYKYANRHPERSPVDHREAAVAQLLPLDERLLRHPYLLRDTPSLADMAIVPFVRQFAAVDAAWFDAAPLPALRAWMMDLVNSPLFASVMTKFPSWQPGDADVMF